MGRWSAEVKRTVCPAIWLMSTVEFHEVDPPGGLKNLAWLFLAIPAKKIGGPKRVFWREPTTIYLGTRIRNSANLAFLCLPSSRTHISYVGTVIDISLTTVKVQNWDKTISTIPTYSLVTESVKNWRGMEESGGRRIKRSIKLDMTTIKFCTPEMLDRFRSYDFLADYVESTEKALNEYNKKAKLLIYYYN